MTSHLLKLFVTLGIYLLYLNTGISASPRIQDGAPIATPAQLDAALRISLGEQEKEYADQPDILAALKHDKAKELLETYVKQRDIKSLYTALNLAGDAIKLDWKQSGFWVTLGNIHSELAGFNILGSYEYAMESYRQALELDPGNGQALIRLGINQACANEFPSALDYFERAVRSNILYLSSDILQWMHISYLNGSQTKRGTLFFEELLAKHPGYFHLHLSKALLHKAHFDFQRAQKEIQELLNSDLADQYIRKKAKDLLLKLENQGVIDDED